MTRAVYWLVAAELVFANGLLAQVPSLAISEQPSGGVLDVTETYKSPSRVGDGQKGEQYLQINDACTDNPHSPAACIKVCYTPGPDGWAGVYWLNLPNNFGDSGGDDLSKRLFTEISFWARGETGSEIVVFKGGGINGEPCKDSFCVSTGKIALSKEWKRYSLSLAGQRLLSVIDVFSFALGKNSNPQGATFYLDDIEYR